ncbi:hypothetical protein OGAPHI_004897, partial [Ogataea philodendri]
MSQQSRVREIDATQAAGDEDLLKEIGYKQELTRKFKTYEIFGIAYSVMGIVPGIASTAGIGLAGGPASYVWGWFVTSIMIITIALAMSENGTSEKFFFTEMVLGLHFHNILHSL